MKRLALALLAATSFSAVAGSVTSKVVKDVKLVSENEPSLLEFRVTVSEYHAILGKDEESFGSKMIASFKTKDKRDLQDYAVVQYIKGCKYEYSSINGQESVNYSISREFFDDIVTFKHQQWVIDSVDKDPIYNSAPEGRHAYYRWNTIMDSDAKETERYFIQAEPTNNRLYVRDMPGTSFATFYPDYNAVFATSTSLKFKTCIFKTEDVPLQAAPEENLIPNAIACVDWDSSFIYNPESKSFYSSNEIAPECR